MGKKIQYTIGLVGSFIIIIFTHIMVLMERFEIQSFLHFLALSSTIHILAVFYFSHLNLLLERRHFGVFPVHYLHFLGLKLWHLMFKRYYIILLIFSSFSYSVNSGLDLTQGIIVFISSLCQFIFTILLFFVLWDLLSIHRLSSYIALLYGISFFPPIFLGDTPNYHYLLANPVSTSLSLPVYVMQYEDAGLIATSFLIIPLAFFLLYYLLSKRVKQWI